MQGKQVLMTEGGIAGHMVRFAIPLFIGNLFQQLYNTADALIVGNMLGEDALAAVTGTGSLVFLLVSFFSGISAGAGVAISRYFGAREPEKMSLAIHTNVAFNLAAGVILTAFGTYFSPHILRLMGTPENVLPLSSSYLTIYFAGSMGLVMYNCLRGIMQAVGDSKSPLRYLIISSLVNVVLDILFIGAFHMNVDGAALATVISQLLSCILCGWRLMATKEDYRVEIKKLGFDWPMLKLIVSYGLPSGLQNSVIAIANVVVQSDINSFGGMAMAGCGAYSKIEGFAFLPINSFTIAITTFVGQNLGAGERDRAKRGAKFGVLCTVIASEAIGILTYILAPWLIKAFTDAPEAIAYGVQKCHTCALFFCLLATSHGLSAVLRGAGKAVVPMTVMLSFWCVFRVSYLHFALKIYNSISVVNWAYPITWFLSTVALIIYYNKADWVNSFASEEKKAREA